MANDPRGFTGEVVHAEVSVQGLKYFRDGLYCSEAMFRAFNEVFGLGIPVEYYRFLTGFGSGLGESGCVCGAVTGCVMALSAIAGRAETYESEHDLYRSVHELHEEFKRHHRALCCRVLSAGFKWKSREHRIHCENYILTAGDLTDRLFNGSLRDYLPPAPGIVKKPPMKKTPLALIRRIASAVERES
ncbi:MAG: C-GCAxxG-C-C family protein [Spirochaetaceae bacterium]|nr:C-GCAxxG-C-C family protein [Spirochaetaceae bacterium]